MCLTQDYFGALVKDNAEKEAEQYLQFDQVCLQYDINMDFLVRSNLIFHEQAGEGIINTVRPTALGLRWLVLSYQTCYIHKLDISEFLLWVARRRYQFYEVSFLDEADQVHVGHLELTDLKTFRLTVPSCYPLEKTIDIGDLPLNSREHVSKSLALNSKDLDSMFCNIMSCRYVVDNLDFIREGYLTFRSNLEQEPRELQRDLEKAKSDLMNQWLAKDIDEDTFTNKLNSLDKKTERYLVCYTVAEKEFFKAAMPGVPESMFEELVSLIKRT
ncbi:hypothetical protein AB4082_19435 [Vibrio cyclitrophicus]